MQEAENRALRAAVANEAKNQFLATSILLFLFSKSTLLLLFI